MDQAMKGNMYQMKKREMEFIDLVIIKLSMRENFITGNSTEKEK